MLNSTEYKKFASLNLLPYSDVSISTNINNQTFILNDNDCNIFKDLCIKNVPFWNTLQYNDIDLNVTSNSLSNIVLCAKLKCNIICKLPLNRVILKKRTRINSILCDHDSQYHVAKTLGDNNCGPRVIGKYLDFTIQEYVEGTNMNKNTFQNLSVVTGLASSLAKFHKKGTEIAPSDWDRTPFVLRQITKWSQHAERVIKKYNLEFDFNELTASFELFKKLLENHVQSSNSPANSIMFCHNDLLYKNVLVNNHGLYLIDFDYAGFNYVGWEIASFSIHSCIIFDTNIFPYFAHDESLEYSYELKSIFVSVYLSRLTNKNILANDPAVKEFIDSLEIHLLGAHLFWTYWSLIMMERQKSDSMFGHLYELHIFYHSRLKSQLKKLNVSNM